MTGKNEIRAKVIGAGSIGNHLAHALRTFDVDVTIVDVDRSALDRTRNEIYPDRYGAFDEKIRLASPELCGQEMFDLCVIGTPPDTHLKIAEAELRLGHKILMVEKPLAPPGLERLGDFVALAHRSKTRVLVAYNQRLKSNTTAFLERARAKELGQLKQVNGRMREDWSGILKAHPWLTGPEESYLSYTTRGGGALYEHSHGVDFALFVAYALSAGRPEWVNCKLDFVEHNRGIYDKTATLDIETSSGVLVSVSQDLDTWPADKSLDAIFENGLVRWEMHSKYDLVKMLLNGSDPEVLTFPKSRPDDFLPEIKHVIKLLKSGENEVSPLDLSEALHTSMTLEAALQSDRENRRVAIGSGIFK